MNIRNRYRIAKFKQYFTEEPKSDFWKTAFIYLLIFRYFTPPLLIFSMMFMIGLASPEADINETTNSLAESLTEVYTYTFTILFEVGQGIAIEHPILSKILFFGVGHIIWVVYAGFVIMLLNMLRYLIAWIINKKQSNNDTLTKPITSKEDE